MSELQEELRTAFEGRGYDVGTVSENRGQLRVTVLEADAPADDLRSAVHDVVGEERVRGVNVTTEALEGRNAVTTVVSFRQQS